MVTTKQTQTGETSQRNPATCDMPQLPENVESALADQEFLSTMAEVSPPQDWQYRVSSCELESQWESFVAARMVILKAGGMTPAQSELHAQCLIHTQRVLRRACDTCKKGFPFLERWSYALPVPPAPPCCLDCVKSHRAALHCKAVEKQKRAERLAAFDAATPFEYLLPIDLERLPDPVAYNLVKDWFFRFAEAPDETGGLVLIGQSGTGKTRTIYKLLRTGLLSSTPLFETVTAITGSKFKEAATAKLGFGSDADKELAESFFYADALFIDDLHHPRVSAGYAGVLLDVLESRTSNRMPTFITMQISLARFAEKIMRDGESSTETAEAITRRIREYCVGIGFRYPESK